jgi:hypothetical protein
MFDGSGRAYNDDVSGTMHGETLAACDRGRRDRPVVVQPRATFSVTSGRSDRQDYEIDEYVGFCTHRLERPAVADDDLGGEGRGGKS